MLYYSSRQLHFSINHVCIKNNKLACQIFSYKPNLVSFLSFQEFDINALLKLDQDLSADVSKASCTEESMLHNTIQDGDVEHGREVHLKAL